VSGSGFEIVESDNELHAEIARRFDAFNRQHTSWDWTTFSLVLREAERVVAAGRGVTNMGLVEIRGLWIEPGLRGRGVGSRLLAAIENEARRRGCSRAALDTYDWQAPGFYLGRGYREWGAFEYPNGRRRHFFVKEL
jgi:GNAT superfamily N-acetyltransferase